MTTIEQQQVTLFDEQLVCVCVLVNNQTGIKTCHCNIQITMFNNRISRQGMLSICFHSSV